SGDHLVKQRYPIVPFLKQMVRIGDLFIEFIQTLDTATAEESQIVTHWVNTLKSDREEITAALDGAL
nr:hypothetical protein [Saprospiraceae bacterium]